MKSSPVFVVVWHVAEWAVLEPVVDLFLGLAEVVSPVAEVHREDDSSAVAEELEAVKFGVHGGHPFG